MFLLDLVRDFFSRLCNSINRFFHKLRRSASWFIFMWENYEWDQDYLYMIMHKKITEMAKYHRKHGITLHAYSIARSLDITAYHLDQLIDSKYEIKLIELHEKKYGSIGFNWEFNQMTFENCKSMEEDRHASEVLARCSRFNVLKGKNHKKQLLKAFEKFSDYWWD